jgi:hypothetical protein
VCSSDLAVTLGGGIGGLTLSTQELGLSARLEAYHDYVDPNADRVWGWDEEDRGWCGSPDIIGVAGSKLTLADLKTSVKPYSRSWPKNLEKGSPEWRNLLAGNMKFNKTCLQLGAYDLSIEQSLGMKVQQGAILVSTPERTQLFKITRNHLNILREKWLKVVEEYYIQIKNCNVYDPDLV